MFTRLFFKAQKYKGRIFAILFVMYFVVGFFGYYIKSGDMNIMEMIYRTVTQFGMQSDWDFFKDHKAEDAIAYALILTSAYLAIITFVSGAVLLLLENIVVDGRTKSISKKNHLIVVGLSKNSRAYINNEIKNNNYNLIIVEQNPDNTEIHSYKEKGIGVQIADATNPDFIKKFEFKNIDHIFISAGSDEKNIEIALECSKVLEDCKTFNVRVVISLSPQGKRHYYTNQGLLDINHGFIEIEVFCYAEEAVQNLFNIHQLDGDDIDIITSDKQYSLMVIGSGELAAEVVYQATLISALPNHNHFKIYCIDDQHSTLEKRITYLFNGIKSITNISIEYLSEYSLSSCNNVLKYHDVSIQNIIVCHDNQENNIEVSADLVERVYRQADYCPKILVAIFDMNKIAARLDDNNNLHRNVFSFAETHRIFTRSHVLKEKNKLVALFMHNGYGEGQFNPEALLKGHEKIVAINEWLESKISDKSSNLAQERHITIKLKALGLSVKVNTNIDKVELLKHNRHKLDEKLSINGEILEVLHSEVVDKSSSLFPDNSKRFIHKLVDCEHERWTNFHFLNGWIFGEKEKNKKIHDCLLPFSEFPEELKYTVLYDVYATLYLPNYLAQVGIQLIDYDLNTIKRHQRKDINI